MSPVGELVETRDRDRLEQFLRRDPTLHFYEIGDLDDFFWPRTRWFAWSRGGEWESVALLYTGGELPALLALSRPGNRAMSALLRELGGTLPDRVYVHAAPGVEEALRATHGLEPHGLHVKMWREPGGDLPPPRHAVEWLGTGDAGRAEAFYREAYPGNWFEPFMLETGCYAGMAREDGSLMSVAGVHVVSLPQRVAALGNIATHPDLRGHGLAGEVTAAVCSRLAGVTDGIGLNVLGENHAARRCYGRLGFRDCAIYGEFMAIRHQRE